MNIFFNIYAMQEFFSSLIKCCFITNKFADYYKYMAIYTIIVISVRKGKLLLLVIIMMMVFINVNANYTLKTYLINSIAV